MHDPIFHFPRMVGHGEAGRVSVSPDSGEITPGAELEDIVPDGSLLQLARDAAGQGATSVEQALEWLVKEREDNQTEMMRWREEARRMGSTMEAWTA